MATMAKTVSGLVKFGRGTRMAVAAMMGAALLAQIAEAGAVGGPKCTRSRVAAWDTDVYRIAFRGGEMGQVIVIGDRDTDLDLFVYDSCGRLIAVDDDSTDYCVAEFWVPHTQTIRIEIRNLGSVWNEYTLRTN